MRWVRYTWDAPRKVEQTFFEKFRRRVFFKLAMTVAPINRKKSRWIWCGLELPGDINHPTNEKVLENARKDGMHSSASCELCRKQNYATLLGSLSPFACGTIELRRFIQRGVAIFRHYYSGRTISTAADALIFQSAELVPSTTLQGHTPPATSQTMSAPSPEAPRHSSMIRPSSSFS